MSVHTMSKLSKDSSFTIVGSYKFKQSDILGSGYESSVYKGTHISKKFEVAIKIINLDRVEEGIHSKLLQSEIRCLQALKKTPFVINLLDIVKTEKQIYVITQICQGDLGNRKQKILPQKKAWEYIKQMLKGYKYLYEKEIIHRDLKPENMFIKNEGQIKIGDFGFATSLEQAKQQNHYNIGSPAYMAPQVLHRNIYSHASDVWSIGVTYYQLLTGNVPWNGQCEAQIRSQITRKSIEDVIQSSNINEQSKKLLRRLFQYEAHNRITPEQLFDYEISFGLDRTINRSQKQSDIYSTTTAQTPKYARNKFNGFLTPRNDSNRFDFDQITSGIFNKSNQTILSSRDVKQPIDKHARRMSFDVNFTVALKKQQQAPNAQKQLANGNNTGQHFMGFKKKHRTSFDVGSNKQQSKQFAVYQQSHLTKIINGHIKLCDSIFKFIDKTNSMQYNKKWELEFNIFRICMKNYLIKSLNKLDNFSTFELLKQIASEQQVKKFMDGEHYKNANSLLQKNKEIYFKNQQILKHVKIARQQKLKALLNAGFSLISVIKKHIQSEHNEELLVISQLACMNIEMCSQLNKKNYLTAEDVQDIKRIGKDSLSAQSILKRIAQVQKMK